MCRKCDPEPWLIDHWHSHASKAEPPRPQPQWLDLNLDFTAQPVVGVSGGQDPSASSWMQQVSAELTLGTGLNKDPSNWTPLDHWHMVHTGLLGTTRR